MISEPRFRLLSHLLLALIGCGTLSATVQLVAVPDFIPTFVVIMAAVTILAVAWLLLRRGNYRVAAITSSVFPVVASIAAAIANPGDTIALAFVVIGIAAAGILVSTRFAAWLGGATVIAIPLIGIVDHAIPTSTTIGAACFAGIATTLLVVGARERDRRERARVAEQARLAEYLYRNDRLSSLGMLAATIGHEIRNPLAYVDANLVLLAEYVDGTHALDDSELRPMLADVRHGVDRIVTITKNLTNYAAGRGDDRATFDVAAVVDSALAIVAAHVERKARIERNVATLPPIRGDRGRLEQVFVNLLVNASQAIVDDDPSANRIRIEATATATEIQIAFHDTGAGIAPADLERIFEPFVTTKGAADGTGLGLAISREIVESFGGTLVAESTPGAGSTFRVHLPLTPR